jgi:hypothetical protein
MIGWMKVIFHNIFGQIFSIEKIKENQSNEMRLEQ